MRSLFRPVLFNFLLGGLSLGTNAQVTAHLTTVATGLVEPLDIAHAGDDRLFIAEKDGTIKIIDENGTLLPQPFIDISSRLYALTTETGLLGLVFHPQYDVNGYFYVHYTWETSTGSILSKISRFSVSSTDPNIADTTSEFDIYQAFQFQHNHNAGDLDFGADGMLYIAFGDGGGITDPQDNGQNMNVALGNVVRIDVDGGSPYSIPPDNPYVNANPADTLPEIWASGLRNPWRFGFDSQTGDLYIGDVGEDNWEEVNFWPANDHTGPNFGWRCREGFQPFNALGCASVGAYDPPIVAHGHSPSWCSITGGRVYRGQLFPRLEGMYIYTDFCSGELHGLAPNSSGGWTSTVLNNSGTPGITVISENVHGELYACNLYSGELMRIEDPLAQVELDLNVILEAPYDPGTGLMRDNLRTAGLIPIHEPYGNVGFSQVGNGTERTTNNVLATAGNDAIVDWIQVELRDMTNPSLVVATASALLQRDGDVVDVDGVSPMTMFALPDQYYVAVRHRCHLGIMTLSPLPLSTTPTVIDFSSHALWGTEAAKLVSGLQVLWTGDVTADGTLKYIGTNNDRDQILVKIGGNAPTATVSGYTEEDVTMDGIVKYTGASNDRDPILVNVGGNVPTNTRQEQLP